MSHITGLPFDPPITVFEHPVFPKGTIVQMGGGGDPMGHVIDQRMVWNEMLKFIDATISLKNESQN